MLLKEISSKMKMDTITAGKVKKSPNADIKGVVTLSGSQGVPVEVKAKSAQAKSFSTIRKHPEKYGIKHFIKFGDYNE